MHVAGTAQLWVLLFLLVSILTIVPRAGTCVRCGVYVTNAVSGGGQGVPLVGALVELDVPVEACEGGGVGLRSDTCKRH